MCLRGAVMTDPGFRIQYFVEVCSKICPILAKFHNFWSHTKWASIADADDALRGGWGVQNQNDDVILEYVSDKYVFM